MLGKFHPGTISHARASILHGFCFPLFLLSPSFSPIDRRPGSSPLKLIFEFALLCPPLIDARKPSPIARMTEPEGFEDDLFADLYVRAFALPPDFCPLSLFQPRPDTARATNAPRGTMTTMPPRQPPLRTSPLLLPPRPRKRLPRQQPRRTASKTTTSLPSRTTMITT